MHRERFHRYNFLNRIVGSSVATEIVLLKCAMDQLFFATQQDFLFLGICAYTDVKQLPEAIKVNDIHHLYMIIYLHFR
jgi:hypothetical protein